MGRYSREYGRAAAGDSEGAEERWPAALLLRTELDPASARGSTLGLATA